MDRRFKDDGANLAPVFVGLAARKVDLDLLRLLLLEPFLVSRRLFVRSIEGIAFVDFPNRDAIVIIWRHRNWRALRISQRQIKAGEGVRIPGFRQALYCAGRAVLLSLLRSAAVAEGKVAKQYK